MKITTFALALATASATGWGSSSAAGSQLAAGPSDSLQNLMAAPREDPSFDANVHFSKKVITKADISAMDFDNEEIAAASSICHDVNEGELPPGTVAHHQYDSKLAWWHGFDIIARKDTLWLAIRGSHSDLDWYHNAQFGVHEVGMGDQIGVSDGFFTVAKDVADQIKHNWQSSPQDHLKYGSGYEGSTSLEGALKHAMEVENGGKPFSKIRVTGHSQGGAITTIIAAFANLDTAAPDLSPDMRAVMDTYNLLFFTALGRKSCFTTPTCASAGCSKKFLLPCGTGFQGKPNAVTVGSEQFCCPKEVTQCTEAPSAPCDAESNIPISTTDGTFKAIQFSAAPAFSAKWSVLKGPGHFYATAAKFQTGQVVQPEGDNLRAVVYKRLTDSLIAFSYGTDIVPRLQGRLAVLNIGLVVTPAKSQILLTNKEQGLTALYPGGYATSGTDGDIAVDTMYEIGGPGYPAIIYNRLMNFNDAASFQKKFSEGIGDEHGAIFGALPSHLLQ
jgi:hypothetical protein